MKFSIDNAEAVFEKVRREAASGKFLPFILYTQNDYKPSWHHRLLASRVERFIKTPDERRLMVFMPPQHGKSQICSIHLPAFALGIDPRLSIAGCSYSADLARSFNRKVQRLIDCDEYHEIFPDTRLSGKRTVADSRSGYLRNTNEFEVVGHKGIYKSVGVDGGLSGRRVDLGIIDDPVKGYKEAASPVVRESTWQWYLNVFRARLHKQSKVLLIMTRWHGDDLAGRLLEKEPDEWDVFILPAIKEPGGLPEDPREVGEALWPDRHSLKDLLALQSLSERVFTSLYQQRPAKKEGNILRRAWFKYYNPAKINWADVVIHFFVDPAETSDEDNDPYGIMAATVINGNLYIIDCIQKWMEFPDAVKFLPEYVESRGGTELSAAVIEGKSSGKSIIQMLRRTTALNIVEDIPIDSKEQRVTAISIIPEAGKVFLPENANWVAGFLDECAEFPNGKHDDRVDVFEKACRRLISLTFADSLFEGAAA